MFNSETFRDHTGQLSFGRRASAWLLLTMLLIALFGLVAIAWLAPVARLSAVADLVVKLIAAGTTVLGIIYASAQLSKGAAHIGDGLAGKVAGTPAATPTVTAPTAPTGIAPPPPTTTAPPPPPQAPAKPEPATDKTATATDASTKPGGAP